MSIEFNQTKSIGPKIHFSNQNPVKISQVVDGVTNTISIDLERVVGFCGLLSFGAGQLTAPVSNDAVEQKMLNCIHDLNAGPSGYNTCTKCHWSELTAEHRFYNNDNLNI